MRSTDLTIPDPGKQLVQLGQASSSHAKAYCTIHRVPIMLRLQVGKTTGPLEHLTHAHSLLHLVAQGSIKCDDSLVVSAHLQIDLWASKVPESLFCRLAKSGSDALPSVVRGHREMMNPALSAVDPAMTAPTN